VRPVLVILAAFAVVTLLLAWGRWLAGRRWVASGQLLLAIAASVVVAVALPLTRFLANYETQLGSQPLAGLFFERIAPSRYRVTLTHLPSGRMQVVDLPGDQWRLDVDAPRWATWSAPLGLEPRYRIERLASRPAGPAGQDPAGPDDAASRAMAADTGPQPWLAGFGAGRGDPLLARRVIQGQWQPMVPGGRFAVRLTDQGNLAVDPVNALASDGLAAR
jgi:hypothetical protein